MAQRRKRYDRQFKVSAAKVVLSGEMTVKGLSEELGIKDSDAEKVGPRIRGDGRRRVPRKRLSEDQQGLRDREAQEEGRGARARERDTKKSPGLLESRPCARRGFLEEHRGEIGPIKKACGLMKVSKSGFYEYLGRKKSNAQIEREALEGFVVEAFERHKGRYGYRRIDRELRKSGIAVGEKRALRIMRKLGLAGKGATRKHRIQKKVEPGDPRLNLVERAFTVGERNRLWVGDITYIPTREGWLYLAAVTDAFSRKVVGWSNVRAHHREGRDRRDRSRRSAGRVRHPQNHAYRQEAPTRLPRSFLAEGPRASPALSASRASPSPSGTGSSPAWPPPCRGRPSGRRGRTRRATMRACG